MVTVTFCGHREVAKAQQVRVWLRAAVESQILMGGNYFLLGGYGQFDQIAAQVVHELKLHHPQIESVFVQPYLDCRVNDTLYDTVTYPPLERVPLRFAISKRNQWMIDQADVVIAYVLHDWGGAAQMLRYAQRKKKKVICYKNI